MNNDCSVENWRFAAEQFKKKLADKVVVHCKWVFPFPLLQSFFFYIYKNTLFLVDGLCRCILKVIEIEILLQVYALLQAVHATLLYELSTVLMLWATVLLKRLVPFCGTFSFRGIIKLNVELSTKNPHTTHLSLFAGTRCC